MFAPDGKTAFVAREGRGQRAGDRRREHQGRSQTGDPGAAAVSDRHFAGRKAPGRRESWGANGDVGTVSLVDLSSKPYRVVDVANTPSVSEGIRFSPDGKYIATSSLNGSTSPPTSPRYKDHALLTIFAVSGTTLSKIAEAPVGKWSQGVAFSTEWQHHPGAEHDREELLGVRFCRRQADAAAAAAGTGWSPGDDRHSTAVRLVMKAVRVHQFGGPEVLTYEEVADPPAPGPAMRWST